ncbi:MAG: flavodoxin family protein [Defluviitaleaceae bacterium]|nr:flavodoxin family protein [Defluviitaleaceae bacterium]
MRVCVLMGSPRPNGNTAELCKPFIHELELNQADVEYIHLHGKNISPCLGCMYCQDIADEYGCMQHDDMQDIVKSILWADILICATPIYSWQATPPLKTVMDRMFGLNKFYGAAPRETISKTKAIGLIATCGYEPEYAADLLDEAIRRLCKHSDIPYAGMYAVRDGDEDNLEAFRTEDAVAGSKEFAQKILQNFA